MGAPRNKTYKRSWKNLLLNKGYQLRFTLFMVGLSALLMAGLGWWVMSEARKATMVSINNVRGEPCGKLAAAAPVAPAAAPGLAADEPATATGTDTETGADTETEAGTDTETEAGTDTETEADTDTVADNDTETEEAAEPPLADDAVPVDEGERARPQVTITSSDMKLDPAPEATAPRAGMSDRLVGSVEHRACQERQAARIADIKQGERNILYVLIGVGLLLVFGLFGYGIKMTHKVAGPLHKVTLYFDKMSSGVYDEVYNLRKGDQLRDFYNHFKQAHGGLKQMQVEDIEVLRAVIERAEAENLAERSPEVAAALDDLRDTLKRKEESLV